MRIPYHPYRDSKKIVAFAKQNVFRSPMAASWKTAHFCGLSCGFKREIWQTPRRGENGKASSHIGSDGGYTPPVPMCDGGFPPRRKGVTS
ncbi:hypothetical protein BC826DRAFT_325194 [Russula brevipes]|nr:hypothetical protein BC826DRAFT_325194 [Russula brevipes]